MVEIIPAILAKTKESLLEQIASVKPFVETIHVDIMDGQFVPNLTITSEDLKKTSIPMITHLMVKDDLKFIKELGKIEAVKAIIIHPEGKKNITAKLRLIKKFKKKTGIAIKPKTPLAKIRKYLHLVDEVLVMTVEPGFQARKFKEKPLEKVAALARKITVSCDGGINFETAKKAITAGATKLYIGSAILRSINIGQTIQQFQYFAK